MFKPLPSVPDHPALEREILERWDDEGTFRRLREQNAGGPRFGFIDGPIKAPGSPMIHREPPDVSILRGKDLACWCPLDQPCHADVLLELANQSAPSETQESA